MSKLDGIKDFIEANKSSLENMNQEMKASYGRAPLVWLTVDEAKEFEAMIYDFLETFESQFDIPEWNHYVNLHQLLEKRIKQTEGE